MVLLPQRGHFWVTLPRRPQETVEYAQGGKGRLKLTELDLEPKIDKLKAELSLDQKNEIYT